MGFSLNTNISALTAYNDLSTTQSKLQTSLQRLSSGYRINNSGDDASGLAISENLQSQISGDQVASSNAQDGLSVLQTADGALTQVQTILHRMRDLSVQAANSTNQTSTSTGAIQDEATQLGQELHRLEQDTTFNGTTLLSGGTLYLQVGSGGTANDQISVSLANLGVAGVSGFMSATATGAPASFVISGASVSGAVTAAQTTVTNLDAAINAVSTQQATIGAAENRLNDAIQSLSVAGQNLSSANSRIQDTDMASEMVTYSQESVLQQAGISMLSQANSSSQAILKLLGD